jgi:hypothetical protein
LFDIERSRFTDEGNAVPNRDLRIHPIDEAAASIGGALRAAQSLADKQKDEGSVEVAQMLLLLLKRAAIELHGAGATTPSETMYPCAAMMVAALEQLPPGQAMGFKFRRDGAGRCFLRIWNANVST